MCDDTEREMVTLGPANTNTCKSDLLEQEPLGSPSGEVILNFRGPRHCDETPGLDCGDVGESNPREILNIVKDQINHVLKDQLGQMMEEQFSKLMRDQFCNTLQNQMAAASRNYCNMESSNVASQGENVRLSGSYMREHSIPSSCNEGVSRVHSSERNWHTGGSSSVSNKNTQVDTCSLNRETGDRGFYSYEDRLVGDSQGYPCTNYRMNSPTVTDSENKYTHRTRVHFEDQGPLEFNEPGGMFNEFSRTPHQSPQSNSLEGRNKKPANYDGKTSWSDYLIQFEMIAELNKWNNTMKAYELATSLRGDAQTVLSDISPEMRRDYTQLVNVLSSRFEPRNQSELYRAKMKNKMRKRNEKLEDLAQDIKSLARYAYPNVTSETREQLAKDCFIDSLGDAELEWAVYQGKPISLQQAVTLALECEAFQNGRKQRSNLKVNRAMNVVQNTENFGLQSQKSVVDPLCREIQSSPNSKRTYNNGDRQSKKKGACHYCGLNGHWKSECRKRQRDQNALAQKQTNQSRNDNHNLNAQ